MVTLTRPPELLTLTNAMVARSGRGGTSPATVTVAVAVRLGPFAPVASKAKLSAPLKPAAGPNANEPPLMLSVPCAGALSACTVNGSPLGSWQGGVRVVGIANGTVALKLLQTGAAERLKMAMPPSVELSPTAYT